MHTCLKLLDVTKTNRAVEVMATCLSNAQKSLLSLTKLWPIIVNNWQNLQQRCEWKFAKEEINYFSCKSRWDLTRNNCTRFSFLWLWQSFVYSFGHNSINIATKSYRNPFGRQHILRSLLLCCGDIELFTSHIGSCILNLSGLEFMKNLKPQIM